MGYMHLAFLGPESGWAAEASECADEQGAFWVYHDKLFTSQSGENKNAFAKDKLKQFAADLKLNTGMFDACLDTGKYAALVGAETLALSSLGVESTPTFLINGRPLAGTLPFEGFRQVIEAERIKIK